MVQINQEVPIQAQPAIASYDFTDIAEGTGVVLYNGFVTETDSGESFSLSRQTLYSAKIESQSDSVGTEADFQKKFDKDFDLPAFELIQFVKGTTALVNGGFAPISTSGVVEARVVVDIKHYDGTTETSLGSATSQTVASNATPNEEIFCLPIPLTEKTFKKGDVLRITVEGWCRGTVGSNGAGHMFIGHDPQNRDGTTLKPSTDDILTKLEFFIPFRIDIS